MEELITRVAAAAGLSEELARKAVGIILAFLQKEGPATEIGQLMAALPGAGQALPMPKAAPGWHARRDRRADGWWRRRDGAGRGFSSWARASP